LEAEIDPADRKTMRFKRLFIMLASQAECAYRCKPVISYDGGFLKNIAWAKMQVLVCGVQDPENEDV